MTKHFFDSLPIELLFLLTVVFMLLMLEAGYRFGLGAHSKSAKAQTAQVRALMGATLGLLAFMLAFTFSNAQTHFENRMQYQIDEAVVAKKAFMQADIVEEPQRTRARELLMEYIDDRLEASNTIKDGRGSDLLVLLQRAEDIQLELWSLASKNELSADGTGDGSVKSEDLMNSVLSMMDMQTYRIQAGLVNRMPVVIWLTLYFTAVMAMIVVGYQAGLSLKRSPIATYSLALAFAAVMILIMDLDRPVQSLFAIDVQVMEQLAVFMRKEI